MAKATEEKKPTNLSASFDDPSTGETFGGSYDRLELGVNEVSAPLRFVKTTPIPLKNDDKEGETIVVNCPVCAILNPDGSEPTKQTLVSLPISATFRKHWEEAKINPGCVVLIKRFADAKKKAGRGSGTLMKIFGIKVVSRPA